MGKVFIELQKALQIRAQLGDDDPELLHEALEGQTDLFEIMDWLLAKLGDEDCMQAALSSRIETLAARKKSSEGRSFRLRQALQTCMDVTGEKSVRRPEATLTLVARKPAIASIDENLLPEDFWKVERKVSRSEINEAVASGEVVPGVEMDNGGVTLTIRRR